MRRYSRKGQPVCTPAPKCFISIPETYSRDRLRRNYLDKVQMNTVFGGEGEDGGVSALSPLTWSTVLKDLFVERK